MKKLVCGQGQRFVPSNRASRCWGALWVVDFVRAQLSMLEALMEMESGSQVLPFVRMFHGNHSTYLWEDEAGVVHTVEQGEGGEQGDVLMPLLCSLGQHAAFQAVQRGIA